MNYKLADSRENWVQNYTPNRKKKYMIVQMNEKPQKCTCMSNIFIYLSKPERLSHLDTSMKCASSHWLATLQHILCLHSAFDGNSASLQHQLTSLNRFCMMFLALIQLRYRYTQWPSSAQQVGCLSYHLTSA